MKNAVQTGLLIKSPCEGVRLPRNERTEMCLPTPSDVDALARAWTSATRLPSGWPAYGALRAGDPPEIRSAR